MKKLITILLNVTLAFTLAACGGGNDNTPSGGTGTPSPSQSQGGTNDPAGTQSTPGNDNPPCGVPGCPHEGYGVFDWTESIETYLKTFHYDGEWKNCAPNGGGIVTITHPLPDELDPDEMYGVLETYAGIFVDGFAHGSLTVNLTWLNGETATWVLDINMGITSETAEQWKWREPFGMPPWTFNTPPSAPGGTQSPGTTTPPGTTDNLAQLTAELNAAGYEGSFRLWENISPDDDARTHLSVYIGQGGEYGNSLDGVYIFILGTLDYREDYSTIRSEVGNIALGIMGEQNDLPSGASFYPGRFEILSRRYDDGSNDAVLYLLTMP